MSQEELVRLVSQFCIDQKPIAGHVSGVGIFNLEGNAEYKSCLYASFDAPALAEFRQALVDFLERANVPVQKNHGFQPHITLAYLRKQGNVAQLDIPRIGVSHSTGWL